MNALVKQDGKTAMARYGSGDPFAQAAEDLGGSSAKYLKFNGNSGEFSYGQDQEELPHGTKLAANLAGMRRGWICWKDSAVVEEIMIRITEGSPPRQSELTDHGPYIKNENQNDGWAEQAAIELRDIATGEEYIFKVTSKSALRALGTLLRDFLKLYKTKPGELPIVELGSQVFTPKNKSWGKKHAPTLKVVEWRNEEELAAQFGDSADGYEDDTGAEGDEDGSDVVEQPKAPPQAKPTARDVTPPAQGDGAGPRRKRGF